jgi:hypothetical protein
MVFVGTCRDDGTVTQEGDRMTPPGRNIDDVRPTGYVALTEFVVTRDHDGSVA